MTVSLDTNRHDMLNTDMTLSCVQFFIVQTIKTISADELGLYYYRQKFVSIAGRPAFTPSGTLPGLTSPNVVNVGQLH